MSWNLFVPRRPYNLVDAAQRITPLTDLWVQRSSTTNVVCMVPFNETNAYYYDFTKGSDDATIFGNAFNRLYTIPGGVMTPGTNQQLVKSGSNFEVAISFRKNGTADTYRFLPAHSGINTCTLVSRTFTRDGAIMNVEGAYVRCGEVIINSLYNCKHPDQPEDLATLRIIHTIRANAVRADVTFATLGDIQVDAGYSIMSATALASPRLSAVGTKRQPVAVALTGSNQAVPDPDRTTSVVFGKSGNSTVILCDWSENERATLANDEFTSGLRRWWVASTNKYYNTPFSNCVIPAGRTFSWSGRWRLAEWSSLLS
jgi:hypothetical protein